uniref:Uncharacterized protein n=1 Tax=Pseudictyota dubia TaxID=2749911 RepID=A0A7R9ZB55_9STRA|mmetsp:Transcript_36018/g.66385  ORF Transcript_36018/g.66385 Transcript_36018/m.66385 type:complete len:118 (+) Transcript_36018:187-540(+)
MLMSCTNKNNGVLSAWSTPNWCCDQHLLLQAKEQPKALEKTERLSFTCGVKSTSSFSHHYYNDENTKPHSLFRAIRFPYSKKTRYSSYTKNQIQPKPHETPQKALCIEIGRNKSQTG